jgi:hypothetical protein
MVMQGFSKTTVLTLALEFVAKVEERNSHRVIEVEQLGVLAQRVHNDLGYACVKVYAWDQAVFVNDFLQVTVSQKDKLLVGSLVFLSRVSVVDCIWTCLALTQNFCKLFNSFGLLDIFDNSIVLLYEVANYGLKQSHAGVLTCVSEVIQVIFQMANRVVCHTNINQVGLKIFGASERRP